MPTPPGATLLCCRDSVAALKRLLREVFADQLTIKQRLSDAEKAATVAAQLEAADDYQLQQAVGGSSSWVRAPVRMSGHITAAGVLPWSQVGIMTKCHDICSAHLLGRQLDFAAGRQDGVHMCRLVAHPTN